MSERCSLADELRDDTDEASEPEVETTEDAGETVAAASLSEPYGREEGRMEGAEETVNDTETVRLDNDPLAHYLRLKQLRQPLHTVSAPARPAADEDAHDKGADREERPANVTQRPLIAWHAVHTSLTVLCPCILHLLPPSLAWHIVDVDPADAERQRFHQLCQQHQSPSHLPTAPPLQPARPATASLLQLSVWLHAACLTLALLALFITVGQALLHTRYDHIEMLLHTALVAFCACSWRLAQDRFRAYECWQSSTSSLVTLYAVQFASSRLVQRLVRRVSEVELVARGYTLSDNVAPAARLDQSQPHFRHAIHIRRTLHCLLTTAMRDNEQAQLALHAGQRQPSVTASTAEDDHAVPSINSIKGSAAQLSRMQSATVVLLESVTAASCPLPAASAIAETLSSLLASSRQRRQLLDNAANTWQTRDSPTSGQHPSPRPLKMPVDCAAAPLTSFRQLSHQLRSAEVRCSLACEQLELNAAAELTSHIDYIRRAVHNVQRLCDELTQQHSTDSSLTAPPIPHAQLPAAQHQTTGGKESTLLSELRHVRRRGQLLDGQGAVFEGEGQWKEAASEDDDEDEDGGQRLIRRRRVVEKRVAGAAPAGGMSHFAASLSMVRELKSVLSHRPTVHFASIQADGDGTEEMQ